MLNPLKNLFGNNDADEFARSLASVIAERYSVASEVQGGRNKRDEKRLGRALSIIQNEVRDYKSSHRLGVYRKARISNTFKWELKEMGYTEAFADEVTNTLVMHLG
ncbi:MAG: hypothetical protein K0U93_01135 [Gammaproteobacteria bacterium]|nr:hypothetical protein [Gammaproteobacteria bacterium]